MHMRRSVGIASATLGLGALTAILLACTAPAQIVDTTHRLPGSAATNPALSTAVARTRITDFVMTATVNGATFPGQYDGQTKMSGMALVGGDAYAIEVVAAAQTLYVGGVEGLAEGTYAAMSVGRISPEGTFAFATDPVVGLNLAAAATNVVQTSPNGFRGTVELDKVVGGANTLRAVSHLASRGAGAAVEFTATTAGGYLTSFQTKIGAGGELSYSLELSAFGSTVSVTEPDPARVVPAPAELYTYVN